MKRKFSGKRYFYWLGGCDRRKGYPTRRRQEWPEWAYRAYLMGHYDQKLTNEGQL